MARPDAALSDSAPVLRAGQSGTRSDKRRALPDNIPHENTHTSPSHAACFSGVARSPAASVVRDTHRIDITRYRHRRAVSWRKGASARRLPAPEGDTGILRPRTEPERAGNRAGRRLVDRHPRTLFAGERHALRSAISAAPR